MIRIFFLSQSSPILELFPFDKITLKSYICAVVTVMAKQCWSQTVLESGSWGHSVLQTPALVFFFFFLFFFFFFFFFTKDHLHVSLELIDEFLEQCFFWGNKKYA